MKLLMLIFFFLPTVVLQASPSRTLTRDDVPPEFVADTSTAFDHETCIAHILKLTNQTSRRIPTDLIFANDSTGVPRSSAKDMAISLSACELLCSNPAGYSSFHDWYVDRGPRIMTWIIPVALLLSNIELSPLDKRRFYALFHALGDPIDVVWSFLYKLRMRTRIYALVRTYRPTIPDQDVRIAAIVLSGFEDLLAGSITSYDTFSNLLTLLWIPADVEPMVRLLWRDAAVSLADARSDERLRSLLAIILYVLQVLSAFVFDLGGGTPNPPGGVIAAALTLTFLIPAVLLSSVIGAPTSRRSTLHTLRQLVAGVEAARYRGRIPRPPGSLPDDLETLFLARGIPFAEPTVEALPAMPAGVPSQTPAPLPPGFCWKRDTVYADFHLHGAKDTYRPWKMGTLDGTDSRPLHPVVGQVFEDPRLEAFGGCLPVFAGVAAGLGLLNLAGEGGFSCRHVLLFSIFGAWVVSAGLTSLSYLGLLHHPERSRKWHWRFCLVKGMILGMGVLVFVGLTAAGFFNSCSCWGRKLIHGDEAVVVLTVTEMYRENNKWRFPVIVACVVVFQLVFAMAALWVNQDGVRVLRWSERRRQAACLDEAPLGRRQRIGVFFRRVRLSPRATMTLLRWLIGRRDRSGERDYELEER